MDILAPLDDFDIQITTFGLGTEIVWPRWMSKHNGWYYLHRSHPLTKWTATNRNRNVASCAAGPEVSDLSQKHRVELLKYKHSDWELARTKIPIQLPVQGYIQSQHNYFIDSHNLNQWFNANGWYDRQGSQQLRHVREPERWCPCCRGKKIAMWGRHTPSMAMSSDWHQYTFEINFISGTRVLCARSLVYLCTCWRTKQFASSSYSSRTIDVDK
jgi:hypothetical protein